MSGARGEKMNDEQKRRQERTAEVIRRIAELKVQALGLKDTPEEYIAKCQERNAKA